MSMGSLKGPMAAWLQNDLAAQQDSAVPCGEDALASCAIYDWQGAQEACSHMLGLLLCRRWHFPRKLLALLSQCNDSAS